MAIRSLLIDPEIEHDLIDEGVTANVSPEQFEELRKTLDQLFIHDRSLLALQLSLCPAHLVDYAICFDDESEECAVIRACFPSHDT